MGVVNKGAYVLASEIYSSAERGFQNKEMRGGARGEDFVVFGRIVLFWNKANGVQAQFIAWGAAGHRVDPDLEHAAVVVGMIGEMDSVGLARSIGFGEQFDGV
jgi:hypothetical protein